jgi:membrane-bound ClpP family serine protease
MTILVLSSLLIIGLILLLAEVIFVPGATVVGILGLIVSLAGVTYAFVIFDPEIAWWITGASAILNLVAIIYGFSSGVWDRYSLKSAMEGGTFDGRTLGLQVGMPGKTTSDLKPVGKAEIGENIYEVKSSGAFIPVETEITIIKIENNTITVN